MSQLDVARKQAEAIEAAIKEVLMNLNVLRLDVKVSKVEFSNRGLMIDNNGASMHSQVNIDIKIR